MFVWKCELEMCVKSLFSPQYSLHISSSHNVTNVSIFHLPSEDAMEYSKEFVTSVVLGKDLVPRYLLY